MTGNSPGKRGKNKNFSNATCLPPSDLAPFQFKSPRNFILRHDRGEQSRSLYFISFPYFLPSNHVVVTIETGGEKKRKASEERVYNLNTYFLSSCACLRVGCGRVRERRMSTLSSTKYRLSSRRFFLIMTKQAAARYCPTCFKL